MRVDIHFIGGGPLEAKLDREQYRELLRRMRHSESAPLEASQWAGGDPVAINPKLITFVIPREG